VESFRPGVLEAMGLDPASLLAADPRLVIARVSGWGQAWSLSPASLASAPWSKAQPGFAAINGFEDREPVLPPMFMGDAYAGLSGSAAAMIALRHAEATGQGQVIDISLFEPLFSVLEPESPIGA
jgi:crotonobetainyl-CoA:carnitine CoA-transferase CaiB-like acyl-CoA transferase